MTDLDDRVGLLARMPQLLVACDYDGTVAPIVDDPMQAMPRRDTVVAMRSLANLPQTHVAVISSRPLRDLAALSRLPEEIRLLGSHGSEFDVGWGAELPVAAQALRAQITFDIHEIAAETPASYVEKKPAGVAFHYRSVDPDLASLAVERILAGPAALDGVHVRHGRFVTELSVVDVDKGSALEAMRSQLNASAVLFIGDDVTDEDAFRTLAGPDVGVKVGKGDTAASFRIDDAEEVARLLARLCELRSDWLTGSAAIPLEHHSMLSDQRTVAIVAPDARITWFCVPRIDSAAMFAELIGGPVAGYLAVSPVEGGRPIDQHYVDGSLQLVSEWPQMRVLDYLDCSGGRPQRLAGRSDLIRVVEGTGTAVVEFAPRLDFGRVPTRLEVHDDGLEIVGTADLAVLRAPGLRWEVIDDGVHHTARAEVDLADGPVVLELRSGTANLQPDKQPERERRHGTHQFWREWADELDLPSIEPAAVRHSALLLRGLIHGPTGALVSAATTSLPQRLGGVRNWDVRYCWLRTAAFASSALVRLGSFGEAMDFLDWVLRIIEQRGDPERLTPLFLVTGRHLPPEAEINDLAGYAGSRPVRVGNAAEGQVQLDIYGPIVDLIHQLVVRGAPVSSAHLQLAEQMVGAVEQRWQEPDHGIWEIRRPPRHHVYSKLMCWVTLDRAIHIAEALRGRAEPGWEQLRRKIAEDVLAQGYKPDPGAFTAAYDGHDLDASTLAIGRYGLVEASDPRFVSTVEAVERHLRSGPTVYRYRSDDGLPGREGGMHLMTSWLVDAYLRVGRRDDAVSLFDDLVSLCGSTGTLSEQYDPVNHRALGNLPHAYSHLALVTTALDLDGQD